MTLKISKDDYIKAPYRACPDCGEDAFGVFSIERESYKRKCRACGHTATFELPSVHKKLIYLDQFAVSNILKAAKPELRRNPDRQMDPFWAEVGERLFRLGGMQLVACPPSLIHMTESILDDRIFQEVQRVYNYLAFGTSALSHYHVRALQTGAGFRASLFGSAEPLATPASDVVRGQDAWSKRWTVLPEVPDDKEAAEFFRTNKKNFSADLNKKFAEWAGEKSVTFEARYEMESRSAGYAIETLIGDFVKAEPLLFYTTIKTYGQILPEIPFDILSPDLRLLLGAVLGVMKEVGLSLEEGAKRLQEFLRSEAAAQLPQNHVSGLMYAALAELAKEGRTRPLSPGMADDIRVISTYLPYFDAAFVDDECRWLLESKKVAARLQYEAKVFSLSNKADFIAYLDRIEAEASAEHLAAVREVYGDDHMTLAELLASEGPVVGLGTIVTPSEETE